MHTLPLFRVYLLTFLALAFCLPVASAYNQYSTSGSGGNCANCHGDFTVGPYTSLADGVSWGNSLHNVHRFDMLGGDCDTCHQASGRFPVLLNSSIGGTGFDPIGCVGCHGRAESEAAGDVTGAGLRQHHNNNGVTLCENCHADADPTVFTTDGEDVMPPYYFAPDANHPDKPTDSCSPNGEENYAGSTIGLDNDGDNAYDQNDSDCQAPIPGDLNGDGAVDGADFSMFSMTFGSCTGDAAFNADADYDADGCITFVDYQTWYGLFLLAMVPN